MKNKKIIAIIGIILIVLIVILIFINISKEEPEIYEELGYKPINQNNIIGTWKATSEQFSFSEPNTNLENYEITFNSDNTYSSITHTLTDSGFYRYKNDRLYLYEKEEYVDLEGNFLQAQGWIKDNTLILTFPQFPKTLTYEKVE